MKTHQPLASLSLLVLLALVSWTCQITTEEPPQDRSPISLDNDVLEFYTYLALGDSYTIGERVTANQNFPFLLSSELNKLGLAVDNPKIIAQTGWRTDDLIKAIANENPREDFNLVSLLIGVNNQYQDRPIEQYQTEFLTLVQTAIRLAGNQTERVFVLSIPDYAFTPFGQQSGTAAMISTEIDRYNLINRQICDSLSISYFDITPISRRGLDEPDLLASDGLHPSGEMYVEWVDAILDGVAAKLE